MNKECNSWDVVYSQVAELNEIQDYEFLTHLDAMQIKYDALKRDFAQQLLLNKETTQEYQKSAELVNALRKELLRCNQNSSEIENINDIRVSKLEESFNKIKQALLIKSNEVTTLQKELDTARNLLKEQAEEIQSKNKTIERLSNDIKRNALKYEQQLMELKLDVQQENFINRHTSKHSKKR